MINSVVSYGAPVWAEEVNEFPNLAKKIRAVQRKISLRVIRGYHTVSSEMAMVLAVNPPIELQAEKIRRVYMRKKTIMAEGEQTEKGLALIRTQEQNKMIRRWGEKLRELADTRRGLARSYYHVFTNG